jgi:glutaredoxin
VTDKAYQSGNLTVKQSGRESLATMKLVVLYTRQGCHLCDDALALLAQLGVRPQVVDIDSDPLLVEQFHLWVPVIAIDGKVRFRGQINETLLARELGR